MPTTFSFQASPLLSCHSPSKSVQGCEATDTSRASLETVFSFSRQSSGSASLEASRGTRGRCPRAEPGCLPGSRGSSPRQARPRRIDAPPARARPARPPAPWDSCPGAGVSRPIAAAPLRSGRGPPAPAPPPTCGLGSPGTAPPSARARRLLYRAGPAAAAWAGPAPPARALAAGSAGPAPAAHHRGAARRPPRAAAARSLRQPENNDVTPAARASAPPRLLAARGGPLFSGRARAGRRRRPGARLRQRVPRTHRARRTGAGSAARGLTHGGQPCACVPRLPPAPDAPATLRGQGAGSP